MISEANGIGSAEPMTEEVMQIKGLTIVLQSNGLLWTASKRSIADQ